MSLDLAVPFRDAISGTSEITSYLSTYVGEPSVHTRRPIPDAAGYPLIIINPPVTITDEDDIDKDRPIVLLDLAVYGEAVNHYRQVDAVGYLLRDLFHGIKSSISVTGYSVVDINVRGPMVAPTDDDKIVGRIVSVQVRLAEA